MLKQGIRGRMEIRVTEEKTARMMGSGELEVFATPAMITLTEETAWRSLREYLEPGEGTVGTKVDLNHISATPVGMMVVCETETILIDRRRVVFHVEVRDECGVIGEGTHERFVVQNDKFMNKALEKKNRKTSEK